MTATLPPVNLCRCIRDKTLSWIRFNRPKGGNWVVGWVVNRYSDLNIARYQKITVTCVLIDHVEPNSGRTGL